MFDDFDLGFCPEDYMDTQKYEEFLNIQEKEHQYAPIAQLEEQFPCNEQVAGSIPAWCSTGRLNPKREQLSFFKEKQNSKFMTERPLNGVRCGE